MEQNVDKSFIRKNMRWGEWLIEKSVAVIASFSIILIFLIFVFVFRESLPLFSALTLSEPESDATTEVAEPAPSPEDDLRPEIYNPEVYNLGGAGTPVEDELRPEIYNPEVYNLGDTETSDKGEPAPEAYDPNAPEVYDPNAPETYDPNAPETYDPNAPETYDPNAPEAYDPNAPEAYDPGASAEQTGGAVDAPMEDIPIEQEEVSVGNLLGTDWQPVSEQPKYGIMTLLIGTAKTTIVAILFGAPLGILAALYSAFFSKKWVREIVKPVIELLAGFPSVVVGFFCLMTIGSLVQSLFGLDFRLNAFVGGIGLGIAVIPIVFTITEDALSSVPRALREASLAVGATEWETAYKVMLPAAFPGVFAAVLLGVGRAFGETMIALMATGNAALFSFGIFDPARTFAATIGAEMGEVVWGSTHYSMLFFLGVLLFIFAFTLNTITELFIKDRLIKKFHGN